MPRLSVEAARHRFASAPKGQRNKALIRLQDAVALKLKQEVKAIKREGKNP